MAKKQLKYGMTRMHEFYGKPNSLIEKIKRRAAKKSENIKLKKNAQKAGKKFKGFRKTKKRAKRPSKNI